MAAAGRVYTASPGVRELMGRKSCGMASRGCGEGPMRARGRAGVLQAMRSASSCRALVGSGGRQKRPCCQRGATGVPAVRDGAGGVKHSRRRARGEMEEAEEDMGEEWKRGNERASRAVCPFSGRPSQMRSADGGVRRQARRRCCPCSPPIWRARRATPIDSRAKRFSIIAVANHAGVLGRGRHYSRWRCESSLWGNITSGPILYAVESAVLPLSTLLPRHARRLFRPSTSSHGSGYGTVAADHPLHHLAVAAAAPPDISPGNGHRCQLHRHQAKAKPRHPRRSSALACTTPRVRRHCAQNRWLCAAIPPALEESRADRASSLPCISRPRSTASLNRRRLA